jgi:hypothetical protein
MQAYQLQSQLQERQSLKVFSALKEARPQQMQKETLSIALRAAMERVHGVRRVSKVLVAAQGPVVEVPVQEPVVEVPVQEPVVEVPVQEPVVEEILRTLDLS